MLTFNSYGSIFGNKWLDKGSYEMKTCKETIDKDEAIKLVKQAIKEMSYSQKRAWVKVNGYEIILVSVPRDWRTRVKNVKKHWMYKRYFEEPESLITRLENKYVIELLEYVTSAENGFVEFIYSEDKKKEFERALDENRYLFVVLCPVRESPYSTRIKYYVLSNFVTFQELGLRKNAEKILNALPYIEDLKWIITQCIDQELDRMFKQALGVDRV